MEVLPSEAKTWIELRVSVSGLIEAGGLNVSGFVRGWLDSKYVKFPLGTYQKRGPSIRTGKDGRKTWTECTRYEQQ